MQDRRPPTERALEKILESIEHFEKERAAAPAAAGKPTDRGINWTLLIPATVTILVAFISVMSSMLLESRRAMTAAMSEAAKAEAATALADREREGNLILEAVRTGDHAVALANLKFFIDAGLISDEGGTIAALTQANRTPTLPSQSGPAQAPSDPCSAPLFGSWGSATVEAGGMQFTIATCTNADDMRGEFLLTVTGSGARPAQVDLVWAGSGRPAPLVDTFRAFVQPGSFASTKKPFRSGSDYETFPFVMQVDGGSPAQVEITQPVGF